jgi:metallo-beta-lactamase class B
MRACGGAIGTAMLACLLAGCAATRGSADEAATADAPARPVAQPGEPASLPARCRDEADWNEATGPRHVFGNTWYIGSCGVSALLVATPAGHVIIDAGTAQYAPQLLANLRALGVDPHDVRRLLSSHEHLDHVGGMAALQEATGAALVARAAALPALHRGRGDRSDPQFEAIPGFEPIANVELLADGGSFELGGTRFTAHAQPGHTPGATTWTWDSCEADRCLHLVYADSVSAIADDTYRYSAHPGEVADFEAGLDALAALPCDILLTPHPGASALWPRLRGEAPMAGEGACRDYAATGHRSLEDRLARERGGATR